MTKHLPPRPPSSRGDAFKFFRPNLTSNHVYFIVAYICFVYLYNSLTGRTTIFVCFSLDSPAGNHSRISVDSSSINKMSEFYFFIFPAPYLKRFTQ